MKSGSSTASLYMESLFYGDSMAMDKINTLDILYTALLCLQVFH